VCLKDTGIEILSKYSRTLYIRFENLNIVYIFFTESAVQDLGWKTSGGSNLFGGTGYTSRNHSLWNYKYALLQFILIAFVQQLGASLAGVTRNFDLEV